MTKLLILIFIFIYLSLYPALNVFANENELGVCPQERKTEKAPKDFNELKNPLSKATQHIEEGKLLFEKTVRPLQCALCHGVTGNGIGDPDFESTPSARNFTCTKTMAQITDGQLFWVIKKGSNGTSMPKFTNLDDKDIWKLVLYIRSFSKASGGNSNGT